MEVDLVDVAENGWGLIPGLVVQRRDVSDALILLDQQGPTGFRMALRNRFRRDEIDARIGEVRGWFERGGHETFTWIVGTTSAPHDLVERLVAAGATRAAEEPELAAMVLR